MVQTNNEVGNALTQKRSWINILQAIVKPLLSSQIRVLCCPEHSSFNKGTLYCKIASVFTVKDW